MSFSSSITNTQTPDVVIVGAGPAGVTASLFLCQAQIPHTLVDKAVFPRDKVDGNVYGKKVIEVLDRLDPTYLPELMERQNQVLGGNAARVFTPNGKSFSLHFAPDRTSEKTARAGNAGRALSERVPFFTMNRRHFDHFLVSKLDEAYVDKRLGTALVDLERQDNQWRITLEAGSEQTILPAKLVVAADGVNSTVLQRLGLGRSEERYYDTVQGYFRGVTGFTSTDNSAAAPGQAHHDAHIEGYFLPESNPGFLFITPLAEGIFSVGVGKPRHDLQRQSVDLRQLLQEAMQTHPKLASRFAECEPVSDVRPWPVMVGASQPVAVSGPGYLVAGDAAGLCNPLTCFGTGSAMVSGMLAAEQVQRSLAQQNFGAESLKAYDRTLYDRFQREFRVSNFIKSFTRQDWLFNQVSENPLVQGGLRRMLKGTSALLKRL
ncbi:MAG: NAD(P)/FAD-dependent oxidoreductase [Leptolyngbyaceae cyanobacterium]